MSWPSSSQRSPQSAMVNTLWFMVTLHLLARKNAGPLGRRLDIPWFLWQKWLMDLLDTLEMMWNPGCNWDFSINQSPANHRPWVKDLVPIFPYFSTSFLEHFFELSRAKFGGLFNMEIMIHQPVALRSCHGTYFPRRFPTKGVGRPKIDWLLSKMHITPSVG